MFRPQCGHGVRSGSSGAIRPHCPVARTRNGELFCPVGLCYSRSTSAYEGFAASRDALLVCVQGFPHRVERDGDDEDEQGQRQHDQDAKRVAQNYDCNQHEAKSERKQGESHLPILAANLRRGRYGSLGRPGLVLS